MSARDRIRLGAAILLAAAIAPVAHAADDAGTQSVFAYGVGDRALAMGSAFAAAADDPSALFWNPAGLGLVDRTVVQLDQFGHLGLGFHESYAGFAMPSWRWGTGAISMRQFGVGGIDQRDDRNVLTGQTEDSELELALGFGRRVGPLWTVGGALKLQRQSLAGLGASGVGIDLGAGVEVPRLNGARFGLAVRNVVPPALRLDRETVSDPLTVRGGVAYRVPVAGGNSVLTALDLEKPGTAGAKLHLGAEYRFNDLATFRAGMNGGVFTMGTGVQWSGVTIDYAFENQPIAAAHRVGLSMRLGRTVDENRLAARKAEDEEIEKRLADTFQQRQAEQVHGLLDRAATARQESRFDDALDALGAALTLEPANTRAQALQLDCLRGKAAQLEAAHDWAAAAATYELALASAPGDPLATAGAQRCRAESDAGAARSATVRGTFAAAMDALAAEDFVTARDAFASVLAADPKDAEAARMLERTTQSLARRAATLVEAATRDIAAGRLTDAGNALDQATRLDPHAAGLDAATTALRRARQLAAVTPRATPVAPRAGKPADREAGKMSDREVAELYRLGLAALNAHRTDDAMRYWEHVWAERPGYREVGAFLKREYLVRGMDAFAAGQLESAIASWEKVLKMYPDDAQARGYVARAQKQMMRSREILGLGN